MSNNLPDRVSWPPTHGQRAHLATLARLCRQFGAARFLTAPIVHASERDFPEPWEPSLQGVHRLLHRLCWHAYWDPEVTVNDMRVAEPPTEKMLLASEMELATATNGLVTIDVAAIGNDDVAGILAHRIGQAFLELAPGDPFRHAEEPVNETQGSVAAVFLGLGVLVANSSMYRRYASKIVAKLVVEEQYVAEVGGLSIADATFLLAVQDVVREDVTDALTTLHQPQQEWVERWRVVLDSHEDELRAMLELDDAPTIPLERRAAPRHVEIHGERDLRKFNAGHVTFRVPFRASWPMWGGVLLGMFGFLAPHGLLVGPTLIGTLAFGGRVFLSKQRYMCSDPQCSGVMVTIVPECPRCGGSIGGTIAHARERLDAEEALDHED